MPNSSSKASTTSTRRAEFTLRSSRMWVVGPTRASASPFFAYGRRIVTTLVITSVSLILLFLLLVSTARRLSAPAPPRVHVSCHPLAEQHARIDVAEAEACLDEHPQVRHLRGRVRDGSRERGDLGMDVLAVDRRMQKAVFHHQHAGDALDAARGAEPMADERLRRGDRGQRARRALERRGPGADFAWISACGGPERERGGEGERGGDGGGR